MEQSHSPSDVLSGLRENPSALMSARLAVKWSPPLPHPRWTLMLERSGLQLTAGGGLEESSGQRGGRSGFFLGHLKGRRGVEVRRRRCWLDTRTLQSERRGSPVAPLTWWLDCSCRWCEGHGDSQRFCRAHMRRDFSGASSLNYERWKKFPSLKLFIHPWFLRKRRRDAIPCTLK